MHTASGHGHPLFDDVEPSSLDVFREFKRTMLLNRRLMMGAFADESTHPAQAGCLALLSGDDGMSQSDLAERLHVSRPTVTTMLQKLEASGMIERRDDAEDARLTRIFLTAAGRTTAERMRDVHSKVIGSTIGKLSPAERDDLARLLATLNGHIEAALRDRDEVAE